MQDRERPEKVRGHSRLVGDRFKKQGNVPQTLVLSGCNLSQFSHPPAKILKIYTGALSGFSHIPSSGSSLNTTFLFQGCVLGEASVGRKSEKIDIQRILAAVEHNVKFRHVKGLTEK